MKSRGRATAMRRATAALCLTVALCLTAVVCVTVALCAHAAIADTSGDVANASLDEVMRLLAARQHGRVEFVEQQFLSVLKRPLESFGEMSYDAPDRLEKKTLRPRPERLLYSGGNLTVERGQHRRVLDLHAYPQIRPYLECLRATLAGDRPALERIFRLDFTGSVQHWTLRLEPVDPKAADAVSQVQITGSEDQLQRIEIRQSDGDRSLMTLRPLMTPHPVITPRPAAP